MSSTVTKVLRRAGVLVLLGVYSVSTVAAADEAWGEGPRCELLLPSPDGDYVAFSLFESADLSWSIRVVDSTGKLIAKTEPPTDPLHVDWPMAWLPGRNSLILVRNGRGPGGWGTGTCDVLLLDCETGQLEPIDFGQDHVESALGVDSETVVCVVTDKRGGRMSPGLYLVQLRNGKWTGRLLLGNTPEREWSECCWGRKEGGSLRLIVRSGENSEAAGGPGPYWQVNINSHDLIEHRPITVDVQDSRGWAISPDGSRLAVIGTTPDGVRALYLAATADSEGGLTSIPLKEDVFHVLFHPDGQRLLLWEDGFADGFGNWPARLLVVDLDTLEVRKVPLPLERWLVIAIKWLSGDIVLLSVESHGIVKLNVHTGEHADLWRIPEEAQAGHGT